MESVMATIFTVIGLGLGALVGLMLGAAPSDPKSLFFLPFLMFACIVYSQVLAHWIKP